MFLRWFELVNPGLISTEEVGPLVSHVVGVAEDDDPNDADESDDEEDQKQDQDADDNVLRSVRLLLSVKDSGRLELNRN